MQSTGTGKLGSPVADLPPEPMMTDMMTERHPEKAEAAPAKVELGNRGDSKNLSAANLSINRDPSMQKKLSKRQSSVMKERPEDPVSKAKREEADRIAAEEKEDLDKRFADINDKKK